MPAPKHCKTLSIAAVLACALQPGLSQAETWQNFTRNPDRVLPNPGMLVEDLRHFYGEPALTHRDLGSSQSEVWDYGTFRAFIEDGMVQRSKLW